MGVRHLAILPLPVEVDQRRLNAVTARAIRVGLRLDISDAEAQRDLLLIADGDHAVLSAAIDRVDHAQAQEWSRVGARAAASLRAARAQVGG